MRAKESNVTKKVYSSASRAFQGLHVSSVRASELCRLALECFRLGIADSTSTLKAGGLPTWFPLQLEDLKAQGLSVYVFRARGLAAFVLAELAYPLLEFPFSESFKAQSSHFFEASW